MHRCETANPFTSNRYTLTYSRITEGGRQEALEEAAKKVIVMCTMRDIDICRQQYLFLCKHKIDD